MKSFFIGLFLLLAQPAMSQTIQVNSGEHDGFSRLVFLVPARAEWELFRQDQGYELQLPDASPRFVLDEVFQRLSRTRLTAIYADPESGGLRLEIGCDCYALAYELRTGVLVVDIMDGTPPEGSSYELSASGEKLPPILASGRDLPTLRPKLRPDSVDADPIEAVEEDTVGLPSEQDWRSAARDAVQTPQPEPLATSDPELTAMRDALLWQLSRSAAKGRIDIVPPGEAGVSPIAPASSDQIRITGVPGMSAETEADPGGMTEDGSKCFEQDQVNIAAWGADLPVAQAMGGIRAELIGEFDRPQLEAVSRAVRYLLFLGFGAEARQMLSALNISEPDRPLWEAMSFILDAEEPPQRVFDGMTNCDSDVALWAVLATPSLAPARIVQTKAVLRAFSALPLHLRRHLGPGLADRFLRADDPATARAIRDAIERAETPSDLEVQLMDARIDLANGEEDAAIEKLRPLLEGNDSAGVAAAIALAGAQTRNGGILSPDLVTALESFLAEGRNGPDEVALTAALALGYASQDRFDLAFALVPPLSKAAKPVWQRLAQFGGKSSLLSYGIQAGQDALPEADGSTDLEIAARLIALGFAKEANLWIAEPRRTEDGDRARLLRAQAALQQRNGRAALQELAGLEGDDALQLKGQALALLGDGEAVAAFLQAGDVENASAAARQAGDWAQVANLDPSEPWRVMAKQVLAPDAPEPLPSAQSTEGLGVLGEGRLALQVSADLRAVMTRLLSEAFDARLVN